MNNAQGQGSRFESAGGRDAPGVTWNGCAHLGIHAHGTPQIGALALSTRAHAAWKGQQSGSAGQGCLRTTVKSAESSVGC